MSGRDIAAELPGRLAGLRRGQPRPYTRFAAVLRAALKARRNVALFGVELLDLPDVSASLGPAATRALLASVQRRLEALAGRPGDCVRLGERGFGLLVEDIATAEAAHRMARRICRETAMPVNLAGHDMVVAVCAGAALAADGLVARELMRQVLTALHEARRRGPGQHCLYSPELDHGLRDRTLLRLSLKQALAARQFHLHYQPVVTLDTLRVVGAEALLRWEHPQLGPVSPARFIPVAEESGLIVQLGELALDMALRTASQWDRQGLRPPRVAVNVSGLQLERPGFTEMVARTLAATDTYPEWLELELTESALVEGTAGTIRVLETLGAMGIQLAVDDFGTGYSSLRYLRDLPVHKVKIDQSFVRDIATDARDARLVSAIAALARGLDLDVVVEGVETEAQRQALLAAGCTAGQGWLFLPAVPSPEFRAFLLRQRAAQAA